MRFTTFPEAAKRAGPVAQENISHTYTVCQYIPLSKSIRWMVENISFPRLNTTMRYLHINSDCLLRIRGLTDEVTGLAVDNATATAVLFDLDGTAQSNTLDFTFEGSGTYYTIIPDSVTAELTEGQEYLLIVNVQCGEADLHEDIPCVAVYSSS